MTILTTDDMHPGPAANGLVEVRRSDGKVLGHYRLTPPDPLELEADASLEELDRERADPDTVWYTAEQVAAKMREWRCSR